MNVLWRRTNLLNSLCKLIYNEIRPISLRKVSHYYNNVRTTKFQNLKPVNLSYSAIRLKSKKQEDVDEVDIFDDDSSLSRDSKVVQLSTTTLRVDAILKSTLGVARNKVEKLFYESKIRVNGKKILKKSIPIRVDYEIDVIKSISPKNPDHLYVARVEIMSITAKQDSIEVTARRFKNLLIENYETDPYKSSTASEDN